ncbi:MAG: ferritin family protein [Planctomycetia bacterium]
MLPTNLSPLEIFDVGIHSESLAFRMYDTLARRVEIATLQARLSQLKKDEKDHRKTLRAHRRSIFGQAPVTVTEADADAIFGGSVVPEIRDTESLVQALYAAVRFEEYGAYFYDRQRHKIPNREARIFFEVLANEGTYHAGILNQQIEAVRSLQVRIDPRGRTVEA